MRWRLAQRDFEYTLLDDEEPVWTIRLRPTQPASFTFWEEIVWEATGLALVGLGCDLFALDLATGATRFHVVLEDHFGHLHLEGDDLFVLGWQHARRYSSSLQLIWQANDVAVDGITWRSLEHDRVLLSAEMDPPGGWFDVELDLHSGRELSRVPAFTPGYVGLYGAADD